MLIDSLQMTDADRAAWSERCRAVRRDAHRRHARHRHDGRDRGGARRGASPARRRPDRRDDSYAFGSSDGLFNLGSALSFVQVLPPGVYVAMNGTHFPWNRGAQEPARAACSKSWSPEADMSVSHNRREQPSTLALRSKLPSAPHDHLHGDVELAADTGAINLSQGFPDSQPHRCCNLWRGTCARDATRTRRCRECRCCARRSPSSRRCTAPPTTRIPR